jgi:glycosyltransferase involved in cell wall biosynthesis
LEYFKILVFNWRCWLNPSAGGAEVFTYENVKRWVNAHHEVTLFTSAFKGAPKEEIIDGIRIVRSGTKYSVYLRARQYYKRYFSKERFDFVIDEINTVPFFTPSFIRHGEKIIALIHQLAREYWFYETPFPLSYLGYYILEDRFLKKYSDVPTVTVSESTKRDLVRLSFSKVHLVPEGLNFQPLDKIAKKENRPVVVYCGRLKKAKRPHHALAAFKFVRNKIPDAELWVVGDGYLKRRLQKMEIEGVQFYVALSNFERRNLIKRAWILVNPSIREGFGLNVLEANGLGTPCIGYNVPGLRDSIRNGITGLLVESGDIEALGKAMTQILQQENLRDKMSKTALEYARAYSWDRSAQTFLEVIARVANE